MTGILLTDTSPSSLLGLSFFTRTPDVLSTFAFFFHFLRHKMPNKTNMPFDSDSDGNTENQVNNH